MASNERLIRGKASQKDSGLTGKTETKRKGLTLDDEASALKKGKEAKAKAKNQSPTSICRDCEEKVFDGILCSCCKRWRHWECVSTLDEEDRLPVSERACALVLYRV